MDEVSLTLFAIVTGLVLVALVVYWILRAIWLVVRGLWWLIMPLRPARRAEARAWLREFCEDPERALFPSDYQPRDWLEQAVRREQAADERRLAN